MQSAPAIDLSAIPAAQRAAVVTLMETVAALTEITRRQEHLIAELNHALHGKRSEKLSEDERQMAFEDLSIVTSPYEVDGKIVGTLGVIGPTRMAYDRVIPMVQATADLLGAALNPEPPAP